VLRYIQQSSGFFLAARDGLADEAATRRVDALGGVGASSTSYAELERCVLGSSRVGGTALRYGFLYGPGTWYWTDRQVPRMPSNGRASRVSTLRRSSPAP
jgi:2-alkyl-3-oxoalkanoate reductase